MLLDPLRTFVVKRLWPFKSNMRPLTSSNSLPSQGAFATQMKAGKVKFFHLYILPEDNFLHQYHSILVSNAVDLHSVVLVNNPRDANLTVFTSLSDHCLMFMHTDERVTQHGMNLVREGVELDLVIIGEVFESAAHYFRELNWTTELHDIVKLIKVKFYELQVPRLHDPMVLKLLKPIGWNLCHENKVIDFVVEDSNMPYGLKIILQGCIAGS